MTRIFFFTVLLYSNFGWTQEYRPFNQGYHHLVISNLEIINTIDSLQSLIIRFEDGDDNNVEQTLINNPQINELQLYNPPQSFILNLNNLGLNQLEDLLIKEYNDTILVFNKLSIEVISVRSKMLKEINLKNLDTSSLKLIGIDAKNLVRWEVNDSYPSLGLVDLNAPLLNSFPIINMPVIHQFSFDCSFAEMPKNLCSYSDLKLISLKNNRKIEVSKCIQKKVKNGLFSNVTIKDSIDGKIIHLTESSDRRKFKYK